jgi:hypothetical protein
MAQFKLGTWQVHVSNTVTAQTHHQHAASGYTLHFVIYAMWKADSTSQLQRSTVTCLGSSVGVLCTKLAYMT